MLKYTDVTILQYGAEFNILKITAIPDHIAFIIYPAASIYSLLRSILYSYACLFTIFVESSRFS
jgi:hypothetical protein